MLRIVLDPENRTDPPTQLDTREVSLQITFAVSDLSKSGSAKAAHSLAFKLPFSDINDEALGYMNLLDVSEETRVEKRCDVFDDDLLVLEGNLQVRSADLQSRTYDCVIYGIEAGIWQTLKKSRWVDVFTYDGEVTTLLDHNHDGPAIEKSNLSTNNDVTDGQVGNDVIHYPLQYPAVQGNNQGDEVFYLPHPLWLSQDSPTGARVVATDFVPAIQLKYLLEQAFLHCGYTLKNEGAVTNDELRMHRVYQTFARENLSYRPYVSPRVSAVVLAAGDNQVGVDGVQGVNSPQNPSFHYIAFAVSQSGDSDQDDFFGDIVNLGGFQPPGPGAFNMRMTLEFECTGSSSVQTFQIGVVAYDIYNGIYGQYTSQYLSVNDTSATIDFQYVNTGDFALYVPVLIYSIPNGRTLEFDLPNCKLTMQSYIGDSPKLSVPNSFGKDTVDKWLSAVMSQFNLVLELDNSTKTAVLHRKSNYYEEDVDNAKDWSTRVDRGQAIVVKNNLDKLYRQAKFVDKEGDDYYNKRYLRNQGKGFTDFTYNSGLALAQPSETVGGFFTPLRWQHPTAFTPTGTPFSDLPRAIIGWDWAEAGTTGDTNAASYALNKTIGLYYKPGYDEFWSDEWPYVGEGYNIYDSRNFSYNDEFTTINAWKKTQPYISGRCVLSWSEKTNYDQVGTANVGSLFKYAYGDEFRKKYSKEARSLEAMLHLSPEDIRQFEYSDLIVIDGIFYNVESIENYSVGERRPTKVKLNKLLDVQEVDTGTLTCGLVVDTINLNGNVTFADRDGVPQTATQACCEFYGGGEWTWNAYTNQCNTGASEWEEPESNFEFRGNLTFVPMLIPDGSGSQQILQNSDGQSYVSIEHYKLNARTKGTTVQQAKSVGQETQFVVPYDCVVGLTITYTAQAVSEAGKGELQFGEIDCTFRVDGATIEKIASDGEVYKNGDAGATSIVVSVTYADGSPRFSIDCTGVTARDFEWAVDVTAHIQRTPVTENHFGQGIVLQDEEGLITEGDDIMLFQ